MIGGRRKKLNEREENEREKDKERKREREKMKLVRKKIENMLLLSLF